MTRKTTNSKATGSNLPLLAAAGLLALSLPTASLAVASLSQAGISDASAGAAVFTPASVDPQLAQRLVGRADQDGIRFTPADTGKRDRVVTVAVRVDSDTARAISLRKAIDNVPGAGESITAITPARYDLGIARGYQSFARPTPSLPSTVRDIAMPDLADYRPFTGSAEDKPSRLQPRITLEGNSKPGRAAGTLESLGGQSVDLGGAYRITRNLDVTAGVRLSQEQDRLAPLTDSAQDSQAVYVGTQFRF